MIQLNTITCGNCVDLVAEVDDDSIDAIVIDPPYGTGTNQGYAGDDSLDQATTLLNAFFKAVTPKLKQNGHIAVFWTMANVDKCIDCVKSQFTFRRVLSMYIPRGNARPYLGFLPRTQSIVIGQKYVAGQPTDFHWELSEHIKQQIEAKGYNRSQLARELGCDSRLIMKWSRPGDPAWCLPTPRFYEPLKKLLDLDPKYDFMLSRDSNHGKAMRKDFEYKHDCYVVDLEREGEMIHPAQKPLSVVEHVVSCLCPKDGVVMDGFSGSGTTAVAARRTGRNFIGFEISEAFCEIARKRLENEGNTQLVKR